MNIILNLFPNYQFSRRERFNVVLGLIILIVCVASALLSYIIAPLFTGQPWVFVSQGLHLFSSLTGILLVWLGTRKALRIKLSQVSRSLSRFLLYRMVRWFVKKIFALIGAVVSIIFFVWINESPARAAQKNEGIERSSDDIWDIHPNNYYDNDPPKPFS